MTASFKYNSSDECSDSKQHTKCPKGYLAWHEWAEKKSRTHEQKKCSTCGFWSIWVRK